MNAFFLENLVVSNLPMLVEAAFNGECRFAASSDSAAADEQGYANSGYEPRTTNFLDCSWSPKTNDQNNSTEQVIANQTRAAFVYEILVPQTDRGGATIICAPTDRLELKFKPHAEQIQLLEIVSIVNQMNVAWLIYAIDIEE